VALYVEYIRRREGVPLESFHQIAGRGQGGWAERYREDQIILNIGRTWRIGPEPAYICIWDSPGKGLERLGEWEEIFGSGEADDLEKAFDAVGRIDEAGVYEPLREPEPGHGPLYYGEFFELTEGATRESVVAFFEERCRAHPDLVLNVLGDRIGKLGPEPRGIAFWQLPSYEALAPIAVELDQAPEAPIKLVRSGLYADLGREVL
jgi:hypothetical protein